MPDIKSSEARSLNMAAIKSRNTKSEITLRKMLFKSGYRYRVCPNNIPGHPDIWMKKYNTAVFVHGCFWHRHAKCKYAYVPKSNTEFWNKKFLSNVARDLTVKNELNEKGIRCLVVWECSIKEALKKSGNPQELLNKVRMFLDSTLLYLEI